MVLGVTTQGLVSHQNPSEYMKYKTVLCQLCSKLQTSPRHKPRGQQLALLPSCVSTDHFPSSSQPLQEAILHSKINSLSSNLHLTDKKQGNRVIQPVENLDANQANL